MVRINACCALIIVTPVYSSTPSMMKSSALEATMYVSKE